MDARDNAAADSSSSQPDISDAAKKGNSRSSLETGSSREIESGEFGSLKEKSGSRGSNSRPRIHSAYMSQLSQGIDANFPSLEVPHYRSGKFGGQARNSTFCSNRIVTSKYTHLNLIPMSLLEQFHRNVNVYFLLISIIQVSTDYTSTSRFSTLIPFLLMLTLTIVREKIEDSKRKVADEKSNSRKVDVLRSAKWIEACWGDLKVGEIIRVGDGQDLPADLIFLSSTGTCYVDTSNIDGASNLVLRKPLQETRDFITTAALGSLEGTFSLTTQRGNSFAFEGIIRFENLGTSIKVGPENTLLRSTKIFGPFYIYAIVAFCGSDTKIGKTISSPPFKKSLMEKNIFSLVSWLLGFGFLMSLFGCATVSYVESGWYVNEHMHCYEAWLTYVLLLNNIVPISLYVTIGIVNTVQAMMMQADRRMADEFRDLKSLARNSNLNTNLGQVKCILTDKTGTLTSGSSNLKYISTNKKIFSLNRSLKGIEKFHQHRYANVISQTVFAKNDLFRELKCDQPEIARMSSEATDFLVAMAACNSIRERPGKAKQYISVSLDEIALVEGASRLGCSLVESSAETRTISLLDKKTEFKVLHEIPFTPNRRRMSVILQSPEGRIVLMCKGAPEFMLKRLHSDTDVQLLATHINLFAKAGLRILIFASKELDQEAYKKWNRSYRHALSSPDSSKRRSSIRSCAESIETGMKGVGTIALQDELRICIPRTVAQLKAADIHVWMVTGDMLETAIDVACMADMLEPEVRLLRIHACNRARACSMMSVFSSRYLCEHGNRKHFALALDGNAIEHILADEDATSRFVELARAATTIIVGRATPEHKRRLVEFTRKRIVSSAATLAVGDGANDVAMLQEADVGVSVMGCSTQEALRSSDFAIPEFSDLSRLLFLHGARSYHRMAIIILYSFYKNIANVVVLFCFSFISYFSAVSPYPSMLNSGWNILYTGIPIIIYGHVDRQLPSNWLLAHPQTYRSSQEDSGMSFSCIISWMLAGVYHSVVIFTLAVLCFGDTPSHLGQSTDLWQLGAVLHGSLCITVSFKLLLESSYITIFNLIGVVASLISWLITILLQADETGYILRSYRFWFCIILIPMASIIADIALKYYWTQRWPTTIQILREKLLALHEQLSRDMPGIMHQQLSFTHIDRSHQQQLDASALHLAVRPSHRNLNLEAPKINDLEPMNRLTLTFSGNDELESRYRQLLAEQSLGTKRRILSLICVLIIIYTIYTIVRGEDLWQFRLAGCLVMTLMIPALGSRIFLLYSAEVSSVFLIGLSFMKNATIVQSGELGTSLFAVVVLLVVRVRFAVAVVHCISDLMIYNFWAFEFRKVSDVIAFDMMYLIVTLFPASVAYLLEYNNRKRFCRFFELKRCIRRSQTIVDNMLPPTVSAKMKDLKDNETLAQREPCLTILFVSILGFEEVVLKTPPTDLVSNLDEFYSAIDELCDDFGIQKVETVSNIYMACAGLDGGEPKLAIAVVELGLEIVDMINSNRFSAMFPGGIKVGIHTGEAFVGVISKTRPTFSLFGDTVNTASRMCSYSSRGRVTVSPETHAIVADSYTWHAYKMEVKGKGTMVLHFVDMRVDKAGEFMFEQFLKKRHNLQSQNSVEPKEGFVLDDRSGKCSNTSSLSLGSLMPIQEDKEPDWTEQAFLAEHELTAKWRMSYVLSSMWVLMLLDFLRCVGRTIQDDPVLSPFVPINISWAIVATICGIAMMLRLPRSPDLAIKHVHLELFFVIVLMVEMNLLVLAKPVSDSIAPIMFLLLTAIGNSGALGFRKSFGTVVLFVLVWIILVAIKIPLHSFHEHGVVFLTMCIMGCGVMTVMASRELETAARRDFLLRNTMREEQQKAEDILCQLLPPSISNKLRSGVFGIAEELKDVTILYTDIVSFTKYSSGAQPHDVVTLLAEIFLRFDELVRKHGVFKVQTIGDAYVAIGSDLHGRVLVQQGAINILSVAAGMLQQISEVRSSHGHRMQMRIGIHTGTIVAGVIGTNRLRFDIWGEDALIANQLESRAPHSRVLVSERTVQALGDEPSVSFIESDVVVTQRDHDGGRDQQIKTFVLDSIEGTPRDIVRGEIPADDRDILWPSINSKNTAASSMKMARGLTTQSKSPISFFAINSHRNNGKQRVSFSIEE